MASTDVTVVIPVFNKARELGMCLQFLKGQSLPRDRWDVVVVDDGSTDESASVASNTSEGLATTTLRVSDRSRGAARARNLGASLARGKILVFLDPDVLPCRDFLSAHLAALSSDPRRVSLGYMYAVGFGPREFRKEFGADCDFTQLEATISRAASIPILQDCRRLWARPSASFNTLPCPWSGCWSGNLALWVTDFLAAGGFDEKFRDRGAEDVELGYRLHNRGAHFEFNREAQGFHFPHQKDDSRCSELDRDHYRIFLQKHPAIEVELVAVFACSEVNEAVHRLSTFLPMRHEPSLTWEGLLQLIAQLAPSGARACFAGALPPEPPPLQADSVVFAGVSEWLRGVGRSARRGPESGLLGMATPFAFGEFDLAVLVDAWRTLPSAMASVMLHECARISRAVVCVTSSAVKPSARMPVGKLQQTCAFAERSLSSAIRGVEAVFTAVPRQPVPKDVQIYLDGVPLNVEDTDT
jgi:glycosyltransferase involved in cell wall biosynthesis